MLDTSTRGVGDAGSKTTSFVTAFVFPERRLPNLSCRLFKDERRLYWNYRNWNRTDIANALIATNIASPTGPVSVYRSEVVAFGDRFHLDCGTKSWPAINVAPGAKRFVRGEPTNQSESSVSNTVVLLIAVSNKRHNATNMVGILL